MTHLSHPPPLHFIQYAALGVKTDPIRKNFAFERHRKMAAIVMGWVAALVTLLILFQFVEGWWNWPASFVVWILVSLLGFHVIVPQLLQR